MTDGYPFDRGDNPVGVRTALYLDAARENRPLSTEIWYPAAEQYRGKDIDPEALPPRGPASRTAACLNTPKPGMNSKASRRRGSRSTI